MKTYEWDDIIEINDNEIDIRNLESVILPAGVYPFSVIKTDKGHFDGFAKIPACEMAKVYLRLSGGNLGKGMCSEAFFLTSNMEWKAAAFLSCVGLRKHGDKVIWSDLMKCTGTSGRCEIYVDQYIDKYGKVSKCNRVKQFVSDGGDRHE